MVVLPFPAASFFLLLFLMPVLRLHTQSPWFQRILPLLSCPHFLDSWGLTPCLHFLLTTLGATLPLFLLLPLQPEGTPSPMGSAQVAAEWYVLNVLKNSRKPVPILHPTPHPKIIFQHWFSNYNQSSLTDSISANSLNSLKFICNPQINIHRHLCSHSQTHAEQQKIQHTHPSWVE